MTRTQCPSGHEYTSDNTYFSHNARGYISRKCRTCLRDRRSLRGQKTRWHSQDEMDSWGDGNKACRVCGEIKPSSAFGADVKGLLGLHQNCRACRSLKSKRDYASTSVACRMLHRSKQRAKVRGLPFMITEDDLKIPEVCPVFGQPLVIGDNDWAPSLDRIDPSKGYVPGNVQVISNKANRMKSNGNLDEIKALAKYLEACGV